MRRNPQIKTLAARLTVRKAALTTSAAARRTFPAWIDAADGASFSAAIVTPRVRDALVLRAVRKRNPNAKSGVTHGPGLR